MNNLPRNPTIMTRLLVGFAAFLAAGLSLALGLESAAPHLPCDAEVVCSPSRSAVYVSPRLQEQAVAEIGTGQGVQEIDGFVYVYGQAVGGVVLELDRSLTPTGWMGRLTRNGEHLIPHPSGIAYKEGYPTFIGGDDDFHRIDWRLFREDGNLDRAYLGAVQGLHRPLSDVERDQGKNTASARPEYVELDGTWLVATAGEYFYPHNYLTLMDPAMMAASTSISDPGVIRVRVKTSACVQTLHWHRERHELALVQNQFRTRGWQISFVDLEHAAVQGTTADAVTSSVVIARSSELEGYIALDDGREVFVAAETDKNVLSGTNVTTYGPTRRLSAAVVGAYLQFLRRCLI